MIPIVLTGTMTPNVDTYSLHKDPQKRKREYLEAIAYYRTFSKVYFLENSGYPIGDDRDFQTEGDGLAYRMYGKPADSGRNKGAQEFEMLDHFVKEELKDSGFIKITGRYIYRNFGDVLAFVEKESKRRELLLDAYRLKRSAFTSLFYSSRRLYDDVFSGAFREMTDDVGSWAEHVFYRRLGAVKDYTFFRPLPLLRMVSGADGISVDYDRTPARNAVKNMERAVLAMMGCHQLLF